MRVEGNQRLCEEEKKSNTAEAARARRMLMVRTRVCARVNAFSHAKVRRSCGECKHSRYVVAVRKQRILSQPPVLNAATVDSEPIFPVCARVCVCKLLFPWLCAID